jgi:ADP-ribose pyrophosphatase YjhB (NUDIX family)
MIETQQKIKQQYKNVAVAIITDEEGKVLLMKPQNGEVQSSEDSWDFPSNVIIPGATYTETFVSEILQETGCIVEAVALVSSEKKHSIAHHYEYVACKVVCRDNSYRKKRMENHKWVHPSRIKVHYKKRINRDITQFLGI